MKNIKILSLILIIILFAGCEKFLDVNKDPNNPSESTVDLIFPAAVENTASVFGGTWTILGEIWSQHWSSAPNAPYFQSEDAYGVASGDYSYDLRGWEYLYSRALMDYQTVKEKAEEEENWTYFFIAEIMQCYTYHVLADFFETIPLSGALQEVPPEYDTGEEVYNILIERIDNALSKDLSVGDNPKESDLVFGGNMDNWVAFANTLKLKIFLRQRFARSTIAKTGIRNMYNNGVSFLNVDAKFDDFNDESGKDNYLYAAEFRGGNNNLKASNTFLSYLDHNNDPRLDTIFEEGTSGHKGMYQGDYRDVYSDVTKDSELSSPYVYPTQPVYFISAVESKFLQAEACLIYDLGDGETLYKEAVDLDFSRRGIDAQDADEVYGDYGYQKYNGDTDDRLEAIIVQKWIALTNSQGMETYFEHNRTGFPKESSVNPGDEDFDDDYIEGEFTLSVTSLLPPGKYPRRLLLPSSEESKNPNFPGRIAMEIPVWWDKR
ncbi:MAG: SusD/RagB family nutrient-binding outer membrane lipoprotein [Bacteroidales bacterium]|nr:SusD/RagB family nutrient-binding outer membrane lipoprotein [Bacteroidales bacterium]